MFKITPFNAAFACLLIGFLSILIGVFNYQDIFNCDYLQYRMRSKWSTRSGYTLSQFINLLFGTFLLPIGITFLLIFSIQSYKNPWLASAQTSERQSNSHTKANTSKLLKCSVYFILWLLSIAGIIFSFLLSQDLLACGIFCFGNTATRSIKKDGMIVTFGFIYLVISILFSILFGWLFLLTCNQNSSTHHHNNHGSTHTTTATTTTSNSPIGICNQLFYKNTKCKTSYENVGLLDPEIVQTSPATTNNNNITTNNNYSNSEYPYKNLNNSYEVLHEYHQKNKRIQMIVVAVTLLVLYPIIIFACMALPTWGFYFNKFDIQAYQVLFMFIS